MKKLKIRLEPKIKVDEDTDEETGYLNNDVNVNAKVNKSTKLKDKIFENICYYFRCFKKNKDPNYIDSRKLYGHYSESSETDLLNDPFDKILNREDVIY